jgi:ketosteroid isomerase-like protein
MIKELISVSAKPGVKPVAVARAGSEPAKTVDVPARPSSPAASTPPIVTPATPPVAVARSGEPGKTGARTAEVEKEIAGIVRAWADAWSRKDVKAYLAFYASDFQTPNGMAHKKWEAERRQRIDKPGKLRITLDNLKVSVSGDQATVRFRQQYTSATLKTQANKVLVLVKSGNGWRIQQERVA